MIFISEVVRSDKKKIADYEVAGISVGEQGRGRREIFLPVPQEWPKKAKGEVKNFSIGQTRSGRPRIVNGETGTYLILSSEGGYTRRGDGTIWVLKKDTDKIRVLAIGNGADGAAGRIGNWNCCCLEVLQPCTLRIRYSGDRGRDMIIFADMGKVESIFSTARDDLAVALDCRGGSLEFDFSPEEGGSEPLFSRKEWERL